jgi:1,4-dihydroxy-2-naphthoate octaprenyltransferase
MELDSSGSGCSGVLLRSYVISYSETLHFVLHSVLRPILQETAIMLVNNFHQLVFAIRTEFPVM